MERVRVGIVGCGNISGIYFQNLLSYPQIEVVACADLSAAKAQEASSKHGVPAIAVDALLADPTIELVVNLTVPKAHAEVNDVALNSGKHVYCEKPLATTRFDGRETIHLARAKGLRVGCAPDTFLGAGIQTCRQLIDDGAIGEPVAANAFMLCHGHESWHPAPEFYYEMGGGPMLDMGPYYLTALVNLMGPIRRVQGSARATFPTRTITSQPHAGKVIQVETPTHIVGVLDFGSGAIGQISTSFDVWHHHMPLLEIYGTEGSLSVPDPNGFGGPVKIRGAKDSDWQEVLITKPYAENSRGLGVLDMAMAIRENRPHRASGDLAFHVLDVMQAVLEASDTGESQTIESGEGRPEAL